MPGRAPALGGGARRQATSTASRPPTPKRSGACGAGSRPIRWPARASPAGAAASASGSRRAAVPGGAAADREPRAAGAGGRVRRAARPTSTCWWWTRRTGSKGVLLAQLSRSVSRNRIEEGLRTLGTRRRCARRRPAARASGTPAAVLRRAHARRRARSGRIPGRANTARARGGGAILRRDRAARSAIARRHRASAPRRLRRARVFRSAEELMGRDLQPLEALLGECAAFASGLMRLAAAAGALRDEGRSGCALDRRGAAGRDGAGGRPVDGAAATISRSSRRRPIATGSTGARPAARGDRAASVPRSRSASTRGGWCSGRARAAMLTSATLAADGDFGFTAERAGPGRAARRALPRDRLSVAVPARHPDARVRRPPTAPRRDEAEGIAAVVAALAETERNLLVAVHGARAPARVRERLRGRLAPDRVLLAQEWDGPASRVSERFRAHRGAVLLGVQSLWEGVDFPGEALEILVVAKLPFSVPDDPLVEARGERSARARASIRSAPTPSRRRCCASGRAWGA